MAEKSMLVTTMEWNGTPTFRMIPINIDCPYVDVIFDPREKTLAVISSSVKEKPQMLPKLNDKGQLMQLRGNDYAQERRIMEAYYEYYIQDLTDIETFVKHFAVNSDHPVIKTAIETDYNK
jgi:hypothetical protein